MAVLRSGTNRIWGAFLGIYFLTAIGVDLFWLFTESGPIGWLADLEASALGGDWYPKPTFMVLLLAEIGIVVVVKVVLEKALGVKLTPPAEET